MFADGMLQVIGLELVPTALSVPLLMMQLCQLLATLPVMVDPAWGLNTPY